MEALDALEQLVRRYSPSGREAGAVRAFVHLARDLGYTARVDAVGNGIARRGSGRPRIYYLGHIDTVEGRLPVTRRRTRLRGRGAVDAKGPLVAALWAGRSFAGPGELRVIAAVGEESDSRGARHLLRRARPDAVIAGEPSGWEGVTVGYKGELQLVATFRGRRTHFSSPHPTAMDAAFAWAAETKELARRATAGSPFRSLTCKLVGFESRRDGDAEFARVTVDFRLPPGRSTDELLPALAGRSEDRSVHARIRVEPVEVDPGNPVVRGLVAGIRSVGGRPTLWRKGGTSDLNLAVRAWSVPGAAYGPGDAHLDHTDREGVSSAELDRSVGVLRVAFERIANALATPRRSGDGA